MCIRDRLQLGDKIEVYAAIERLMIRGSVPVNISRSNGCNDRFNAIAAVETKMELELLAEGGVIPVILKKTISDSGQNKEPVAGEF